MGGVAAVFSKSRADAPRLVAKILYAMQHRAKDGAAIACNWNLESAPTVAGLTASLPAGNAAIGYGFTRILPSDSPQPVRADNGWLCLDGRIVERRMLVGGKEAARVVERKLSVADSPSVPNEMDGAYALCFCTDDQLLVARDQVGLKPLFMGRSDDVIAVASDRKALRAAGIGEVTTFPPGARLKVSLDSEMIESPEPQACFAKDFPREANGARELSRELVESVLTMTTGVDRLAAGFSGGVDSAVLAKIAKDAELDLLLVTVGVGRTREMIQAESTASDIGLPIVVRELSKDEVEESLDHVLWLIEEPDLMKVSIGLAIHWTARVAIENERSVIMLGQGSDELFGGYKRFATVLGERGVEACEAAISESVRDAYRVNYERDEQAVSSLRAELRLPFATRRMTELAMGIPLAMKVRSSSDNVRKWILREAAIGLGIPSAVAMRPKRAIQYASGIEKAIRSIARRQQLDVSAYLRNRLRTLERDYESG